MCLVYITLARKILCYGSFPAKVLLGTNAYNSLILYETQNINYFKHEIISKEIAIKIG